MSSASPILLADIGGTHCRFALLASSARPEQVVSWSNDGFDSLEAAIARYISEVGEKPKAGMFAVAGPIIGRTITLTNRNWHFNLDALGARFGFSSTDAINDFEAQAWALGLLQEDDTRSIGNNTRAQRRHGAKVVLGPGTGLGVAALVPVGSGWQAVPTEGGHVSFGAATQDEEPVFARLHQAGPVSAEMVISGSGLPRLHGAVNPGATPLASAEIVGRALAGNPAAAATIKLFVRLLGRFAGDVALTFKAIGGVYIAGGVTGKLGALLDEDIFRTAFEAHPPYGELLQSIPTYLVTVAHPGLIGCAACARARLASG
jgi:glucokinase